MNSETTTDTVQLRIVIADEQKPLPVRQAAAELLIQQIAEAAEQVPVADDDPEAIELMAPFQDSELMKMMFPSYKPSTLAQTKKTVAERRKLRAVLAAVVDESAHQLERLAGCAWVLEARPEISRWRMNQYGPEKLLSTVIPPDGVKWTSRSLFEGPTPVLRPPQSLQDVWAL